MKNVIVSVESTMTYREYIFPTLISVGLLLIIYLLAYVGTILETEKFVSIVKIYTNNIVYT